MSKGLQGLLRQRADTVDPCKCLDSMSFWFNLLELKLKETQALVMIEKHVCLEKSHHTSIYFKGERNNINDRESICNYQLHL
ncbi:hypothetical protein H5410_060970 [Solanum commersonii]|uniref:Uncharacterized protein n=1 Tax=Solanum commersonii TaxID=4109 RepID=A0A9J5W7K4_SOLCO|nr:hypothetical protein H5410_060970 [Solanum commersonii]